MPRRPRGVRFRYIAFCVDPAASRAAVAEAVRSSCERIPGPVSPSLIVYRDGGGLVRCGHIQKDSVIAALNGIVRVGHGAGVVRTLGTSGTIRKATEKFLSRGTDTRPTRL